MSISASAPVHGLFIDGRQVPASIPDLLDVINPATGQLLAQISHANAQDVDRAVRSSHAAFESAEWSQMGNRTRARLIDRINLNLGRFDAEVSLHLPV